MGGCERSVAMGRASVRCGWLRLVPVVAGWAWSGRGPAASWRCSVRVRPVAEAVQRARTGLLIPDDAAKREGPDFESRPFLDEHSLVDHV